MDSYHTRPGCWPWAGALAAIVTSLALLSVVLLLFDSVDGARPAPVLAADRPMQAAANAATVPSPAPQP